MSKYITIMSKIKSYNQVILAIIGTIAILFMVGMGIFLVIEFIGYSYDDAEESQGILAIDETNQLLEDSIRKQIISFNQIEIIDSTSQTYLLPVTQADLAEGENYSGLLNMYTGSIGKGNKYYSRVYNNLVLHNSIQKKSTIIFNQRISIEQFFIFPQGKKKFIIITGCSKDSNKDGFLNSDDLQELFVYDYQTSTLHKIESEDRVTTIRVFKPHKSIHLIGQFGIDRNKNGIFEGAIEPRVYYKVDLINKKLVKLINNEQINQLQKLLEGR